MKRKISKRLFAYLLSFSMLLTLLPASAYATEVDTANANQETLENDELNVQIQPTNEDDEAGIPQTYSDEIPTEAAESTLPESEHNYANSYDNTWEYTVSGATNGVIVTFDAQTEVESGYDYIYVLDGDGNEIGKYTGTTLAGGSVYVPTATVKIRLTSDRSGNAYGFKVTSVEACGETIDLSKVGSVDEISPVPVTTGVPSITVLLNGNTTLTADVDYTVSYDVSNVGTTSATITGKGKYSGSLEKEFYVYDNENLLTGASVKEANILLRQAGETGSSYISFSDVTGAWSGAIESVTLTPVNSDGSAVDTGTAVYPNAPKEITLTKDQLTVKGSSIYFNRTASDPIVYVMQGHEPIEIKGRWSTNTYPQSQQYKVTVKANGYQDTVGTTTYYTGTASDFSIIIDADGDSKTTEDQEVVKTYTYEEIQALADYANGSSQCGMTGFRTFSGEGVTLKSLLEDADVTVSDSDYFLLDTSDHYGNNFTYDELFNTTRYFLSSIYDEGFADYYASLVSSDNEAGSTIALRRYLAEKCLENKSTVEPRININYTETVISGDDLNGAVLPTADNYSYNSLVSYENQYRFFYGIALVQDDCTVTFDSQGGSDVAAQTVLSHMMTSTSNTTIKSSYWANSLVIYRGAGEKYKTTASTAAKTISEPEVPTKEGYVFGGWYTDAACTDGNLFDFTANDGTVDQNTTLYAKWIPQSEAIQITDFDITNTEHDDADAELNQTIIATITFDSNIKLNSEDLSSDLLITIAGGDVNDTARKITYEVKNGNQLVITMVSKGWAAIYGGALSIREATAGLTNLVSASDDNKVVVWSTQSGRIPIGITVSNDTVTGTSDNAAKTQVTVTHKANMRGMYSFELVSIVDGTETVIGTSTSHAHNFYSSIDEKAIASAMATAINGYEGYTTTYTEGDTSFVVTADEAVEGQTLAVRMVEYKATVNYAHVSEETVIENRIAATATTDGSYDTVIYCTFCGDELNRETTIVPATGETSKDPETKEYSIVKELSDDSYTLGSGKTVTIYCTGALDDFVSVSVDGKEVDKANYTLKAGSTILTFNNDYLETLSAEKHTVVMNYTDGKAEATLTVSAKAEGTTNPSTTNTDSKNQNNQNNTATAQKTSAQTTAAQTTAVKTGDTSAANMWFVLFVAAAAVAVAGASVTGYRKRYRG
jgi:uncharacterized repeat protein (TIGR02543 family)